MLTPASILFWSGVYGPTASLLESIDVDPLSFLLQTTILLAAPLATGMFLAAKAPRIAAALKRPVTLTGAAMLAGAIVYGTFLFHDTLFPALPLLLPIAVLHNALAFLAGALAARAMKAPKATRRLIGGTKGSHIIMITLKFRVPIPQNRDQLTWQCIR